MEKKKKGRSHQRQGINMDTIIRDTSGKLFTSLQFSVKTPFQERRNLTLGYKHYNLDLIDSALARSAHINKTGNTADFLYKSPLPSEDEEEEECVWQL